VVDSPDAIVNQSVSVATAFMELIEEQHKKGQDMYVVIGKKKYLLAHSWSFLLMLYEVHPVPVYVNEVREKDGKLIGYEAKVELQKHDQVHGQNYVVGAGIMFCGVNDWATKIRKGEDKRRPGESAAQTYAMSKAARLAYGHIPTLVGYEALPYEELLDSSGQVTNNESAKPKVELAPWVADMPDNARCPTHEGKVWFKKGNMTSYAHPIEDANGNTLKDQSGKNRWCNMPIDTPVGVVTKKRLGTPKNLAEFQEKMEQKKVDSEKLKTILGCGIEQYLDESPLVEAEAIVAAHDLVRDVMRDEAAAASQELFG
jgi:hypothetical protein